MTPQKSFKQTVLVFLDHTGRMWIGNPLRLIGFALRFVQTLPFALADVGSRNIISVIKDNALATALAIVRGLFSTVGFGFVAALIVGAISNVLGAFSAPAFQSAVFPWILSGGLPLMLALLAASRAGAMITASYATWDLDKVRHPGSPEIFSRRMLETMMIPQIISVGISRLIFYAIVSIIVLYGYTGHWSLHAWPKFHTWEVVAIARGLKSSLIEGLIASGVYGAIIAFTAAAFGVMAREDTLRGYALDAPQEAFWQSATTSTTLCIVITVSIWLTL